MPRKPPIKAFDDKFTEGIQEPSGDHNALKGYSAMYIVKVLTERMGKVDPEGLCGGDARCQVHGQGQSGRVARRDASTTNGDLDRESFMTKVVNGKQVVVATLPPASAK